MKSFSFPLGRVLEWRSTQARLEEAKLEQIYAELRAIEQKIATLAGERNDSERAVLKAASATAPELEALDTFRRFAKAEGARLEKQRAECSRRVAAQAQTVAAKRRDMRLLERLRERRLDDWNREFHRELDRHADESFLAKWRPGR